MIIPMQRLLLAGRVADREAVLNSLREVGVVHVEPVYPELVHVPPDLSERIARAANALEVLAKLTPPAGTEPFADSPAVLVAQLDAKLDRLSEIISEQRKLAREMERVAPWGRIDKADLEALRANGLEVAFLVGPEGCESSIEADLCHVVRVKDGAAYVLAVSHVAIPPSAAATRIEQPTRDVFELAAKRRELDEEKERIDAALSRMAGRLPEVRRYRVELEAQKRFSEVEMGLLREGPIFVLKGWVPAGAVEKLKAAFAAGSESVGLQFSNPDEDEQPPTQLRNPWWCRPIEVLYKVLGITPGYREVDISPFFLPFLTIFTAMIFADAGYGLVAFIALLLLYKPATARGVPKDLFKLFLVLFAGTIGYGLVMNSYFGVNLIRLIPFDPLSPDGEQFVKKFCFFLGAFHITVAHLWKMRRNPIGPASLAEFGWVLFTWAMYGLVCVLVLDERQPRWMLPLFGVALTLVLFFTVPSWNVFKAVGRGLGAIALSAAGFLSDIISYIRLWAVGLAGSILAASFNELARPLPLLLAILVLAAAHFLNMALCMVAVFAHGVRLNLLEFSNHVGMEWNGREYEPFKMD